MLMRKWTHGFNLEKVAQQDESMKKITMLFPGFSLEYNLLLPTIWSSFGMMLEEELTLAVKLKNHLGPPFIRFLL